jgi:hypothetical protein
MTTTMRGKLLKIETTSGSPFGEQRWTVEIDGKPRTFSMWESASRWPLAGSEIVIEKTPNQECHTGYGKIILASCARLVSGETTPGVTLHVPDDAWTETGWNGPENSDRLLAQVTIMGTRHHLEAYRAKVDENDCIVLANPEMEEELMPTLQKLYSGAYSMTTIRGEQYVLFMFPHAD